MGLQKNQGGGSGGRVVVVAVVEGEHQVQDPKDWAKEGQETGEAR